MATGGNNGQGQKPAKGQVVSRRKAWLAATTQVFAYGWTYAIPLIAFLWTIVILIYALSLPSAGRWTAFATAVITGSCSFLAGGLIGLLFGIPRAALTAAGNASAGGRYTANSNLVEVSDWLTKIIVGVGLVQIGRLEPTLAKLAANLKAPLGGQPSSSVFGIALVIANVLLGFLFFYLWARSLLQRDLELSDGFAPSDDDGDGNGNGTVVVAAAAVTAPATHAPAPVAQVPAPAAPTPTPDSN
jgi:hypothetical protein